jgi:tetratricopeptide (TPR) repeat protein
MNSWHSWSPCGKWLVFSSKANSPYTQLWITHIDEQGNSTPPVVLANLTAPGRAANIPEFVNLKPGAITRIHEQFLNDYSYERAGNEFFKRNDPDSAIQQYRKALQLNPNNVNAHQKLGFLLYPVKHQYKEGMTHSAEALRLDANNGFAHCDLGMALLHQGQSEPAIGHLLTALRLIPAGQTKQYDHAEMRYNLAHACLQEGKYQAGADQLLEVIRLDPNNADAYYLLALAQASQGMIDEPLQHYSKAIALNPGIDTSVNLHDLLGINYAKAGQLTEAILSAERALRLARAAGNHSQARTIEARLEQYRRKRRP